MYATSVIMILGTPVLAVTVGLVGLERAVRRGDIRTPSWGRPILFQHLFCSTRTRPSTSCSCPVRVINEIGPVLLAAAGVRLQGDGHRDDGDRLPGFLVGATTCSSAASRCTPAWVFSILQLPGGDPLGGQGVQLDGDPVQGSVSGDTPMLYALASSACSRSAG